MDGVPYVWLYTPNVGWSWYVSPWGNGGYRYGAWVRHPWHPRNAPQTWVAPQHVHARLGRPGSAQGPRREQPHEQRRGEPRRQEQPRRR